MTDSAATVLKLNQEVLDSGGARHMDWGGMALQFPAGHQSFWESKYPELDSPDADIQLAAWNKFLRSDESKPYRVSKPKYFRGH